MTLKKIRHSLLLAAMVAVVWSCGSGGSVFKLSTISPPTDVKAEAVNSTTIKVTWTAVEAATGYVIYHSTSPGSITKSTPTKKEISAVATNAGEVSEEIAGFSPGTYYVVVATKDEKGESARNSNEVSVTLTESISGVPLHEGATWTKSELGPTPLMWLDQGTTGDNGEVLGSRSINKGRLTYKVTGISSDYTEKERWIMWLLSDVGGAGTNFQLMVVESDHTRLIMQRFNDFTACDPRGLAGGRWGCEEQDIHGDLFFEPSQTYAWDCYWDGTTDPKLVSCVVTSTDGSLGTVMYQVGMGGEYGPLTEMGIGTFSIDGYPVVDSTVTDFRFSVM